MVIKLLLIIAFWTTAILCDSRFVIMVKLNDLENYAVDLLENKNFTTVFSYEKDLSMMDICSQLFETRSYEFLGTIGNINVNLTPTILNLNEDQKVSYEKQAEYIFNNWGRRNFVIAHRTFSLTSFPCFDHDGKFKWIVAYDFNLQLGLLFLNQANTGAQPELAALIDTYSIVKLASNNSDSNTASGSSSNPTPVSLESMFLNSLATLTEERAEDPLKNLDENSKFRLCSMGIHVILRYRGSKSVNQNAEFSWTIENPNQNYYCPIHPGPNAKVRMTTTILDDFNLQDYRLYCHMLIQGVNYGFYLSKDAMNPNRVFIIERDDATPDYILLEQLEVNWLENAVNKIEYKGLSNIFKKFMKTKSGRYFST